MAYVQCDFARLTRDTEYADLAGLSLEDMERTETFYEEAEREAREVLAQIQALRSHSHDWNDDGFCTVCGADGNA